MLQDTRGLGSQNKSAAKWIGFNPLPLKKWINFHEVCNKERMYFCKKKNTNVRIVCVLHDLRGIIFGVKWSKQIRIGRSMSLEIRHCLIWIKHSTVKLTGSISLERAQNYFHTFF